MDYYPFLIAFTKGRSHKRIYWAAHPFCPALLTTDWIKQNMCLVKAWQIGRLFCIISVLLCIKNGRYHTENPPEIKPKTLTIYVVFISVSLVLQSICAVLLYAYLTQEIRFTLLYSRCYSLWNLYTQEFRDKCDTKLYAINMLEISQTEGEWIRV